jgi:hypothetical protein
VEGRESIDESPYGEQGVVVPEPDLEDSDDVGEAILQFAVERWG